MMFRSLSLLLVLIISSTCWSQQLSDKDRELNEKIDDVVSLIFSYDITGLRAVGEFLDDEAEFTRVSNNGGSRQTTPREIALGLIYYNCYFDGLEVTKSLTRDEYISYVDEHITQIKYYHHLGRFTNIDADNQDYEYRIRKFTPKPEQTLEDLKVQLDEKESKGYYKSMVSTFFDIGSLGTPEAEKFLLKSAEGKNWKMNTCEVKENILSGIAFALGNFRNEKVYNKLIELQLNYKLYAVVDWLKAMSRLANTDLAIVNRSYEGVGEGYEELLNKYGSLEKLREEGYKEFRDQYKISGADPIDMVDRIEHEWWIFDNLKKDLLENKDPKVLHLISRRMLNELYVYNDKSEDAKYNIMEKYEWASLDFNILEMLQNLTHASVEIKVGDQWVSESDDFKFNIALMNYWRDHYNDYKYNKKTDVFENVKDQMLEPDMIKTWFEQMHSEDDDLAMKAYINLTEADLNHVKRVMTNYDMDYIMGSLNNTVPMFTKKFLIQQCRLSEYCRENGITYKPNAELKGVLEQARDGELTFNEQVELENKLLRMITTENVTAVENFGIFYSSRNHHLSGILGHVLDLWYSENISKIIKSPSMLRAFLVRAELYDHLGIVGVVNNYLRKLVTLNPEQQKTLKYLSEEDSMSTVRENALWAMNNNLYAQQNQTNKISFGEFLNVISDISEDNIDLVTIDTLSNDSLELFFRHFNEETDPDLVSKYVRIIGNHLHNNLVPYLIRSFHKDEEITSGYWGGTDLNGERHTINYTVKTNDYLVYYVEKIFDHYNPIPRPDIWNNQFVSSSSNGPLGLWNKSKTQSFWVDKWSVDSTDYRNWGLSFFTDHLEVLEQKDTITYSDLENIVESDYYNEDKHLKHLEGVLDKMSCDDIEEIPLSWNIPSYTFAYISENCDDNLSSIETITEKYWRSDLEDVLPWMKRKIESADERIKAQDDLNGICWADSFRDTLKSEKHSDYREWVKGELLDFSENTSSSFDKKYAYSFYLDLHLSDQSFAEQLESLKKESNTEAAEEVLIDLVRKVQYEDVIDNWTVFSQLLKQNSTLRNRFESAFGLFITDEDYDNINEIGGILSERSNEEASFYLVSRYIDIGTLEAPNYEKIYELLMYSNVDGFAGSSQSQWNSVYTALKVYMTMKWKDELLAFQKKEYPKISEIGKEGLLNFLVDRGLIESKKYVPVTFANKVILEVR